MEELLKDLRDVCEKHEMEVKCGQSPIEVKRVNYRHRISDDTHNKVYGVNKQMCDIGKTILTKKENDMEEKKTIEEWKETFVELYKAMRKDLGASDLDVYIYQNNGMPKVNFDVKF